MWDEQRLSIEAHGLEFADFKAGFDLETAIRFDPYSSPTGRARYALVGWYRGRLVTVGIVSPLGAEALSLASFRHHRRRKGLPIASETHAPGCMPNPDYTQQDWDDVHSPELPDEQLAIGRPAAEVWPELVEAVRKRHGQ